MKILKSKNIYEDRPTAITLGNFDGIHLGHQELISSVKKYAEKYSIKSVVFSFSPHPKSFFNSKNFNTIFSSHEKEVLISAMNVEELILYPFTTDFADMEPKVFADFIFEKMKCKVLIVGEDYCFGKNRKGNCDLLESIAYKKGANVIEIPPIKCNNIRVSSTHIRKCIEEKNFNEALKLLGKPYFVMGIVTEGKRNGRMLQFPTANVIPPKDKLLPSDGVYITKTFYNGTLYNSITNIGQNPTFGGKIRTVETYIFDFDGLLYGKEITVCFLEFIRNEKKFNSVDELKRQISDDRKKALEYLIKH